MDALSGPAGCRSCSPEQPDRSARDWTSDPYGKLVSSMSELTKLIVRAREEVAKLSGQPDGGALMRAMGNALEAVSGLHDFAFFLPLPKAGTPALLLRALCPLRDLTLEDGGATTTGAFVDSFERATGLDIIRTNIAMVCWRKGEDGVELTHGQAGCVDPTGQTLKALTMVKDLHFMGLQAAGVKVVGIIASSNASQNSFEGINKKTPLFSSQHGEGIYEGVRIFPAPHPKYVSPCCMFNQGVALSVGAPLGDALAVTSRVLDGWASVAASVAPQAGRELLASQVYHAIRMDPLSPAVVREWEDRYASTTSPETHALLVAALRKRGYACAAAGKELGAEWGLFNADGTPVNVHAMASGVAAIVHSYGEPAVPGARVTPEALQALAAGAPPPSFTRPNLEEAERQGREKRRAANTAQKQAAKRAKANASTSAST